METNCEKAISPTKKVLMLFSMSFLPHQGRYLRVRNQAKTLIDGGYPVTILAWDRDCTHPKKEIIDGIKVERIWSRAGFQRGPLNFVNFIAFYLRVLPRLWKAEADVFHCFNLDTVFPGWLAARLKGRKAVLDLCEPVYYANWPRKYAALMSLIQHFERFFSKRFDYVLVHGSFQVEKFESYHIRTLEQIGSYPNRSLIRDRIQDRRHADGTIVIGRIGSIYKNNGIEEMIEAFKRLLPTNPKVKLLLAGKVFQEFREDFQSLIAPIADRVEIVGSFLPSDLPRLYERIDISLQLSRRTDWFQNITPTKFFETLANGVPVVASDTGDVKQIVDDCNCGIIVDETKPESICAGLRTLIEDPGLRREMAKNGLRAIQETYNWEQMGGRLLAIYRMLGSDQRMQK